jgi:hypothetical protein
MTEELQDLRVENSLLRGTLWLTARSLKGYLDAKHRKVGEDTFALSVSGSVREKATEALARAQERLVEPGRGR